MTTVLKALVKRASMDRQTTDLEAWKTWKKNPTDEHASALLAQVNPLIQREVSKWSGSLAKPLLETEGKQLAMDAFHTYDPDKGAALGTHVVNQLQRMSRLVYSHQNIARMPENKILQFHSYNIAHNELSDSLGRSPTADELSDHLAWPVKRVEEYRKMIGQKERLESGGLFESTDGGLYGDDVQDHTLDFIHHGLPAQQKVMFEHLTGYGGAERLSNQAIQKKLGLTQGQYSYLKSKLISHVASASGSPAGGASDGD